ncbi:hypothetical protein L21SP3_00926 [Sedimentisphaera cyanobacteriorum]|uniref:Uncharacterized protein n=1 Tax=Sedimentisphaera cyanobacteriorum TaxID=1940790 RepID=A0A1Q2HPD4_9BACT|nr:hypothetical protein [Sedimentisphaera cyanobacteriorum]AQQ09126.1 hypothetical protein L21SP3_00926 [Sedimentisphaera cyanobacteriorum]
MNKTLLILLITLGLFASEKGKTLGLEDYSIIYKKNIFSKNRIPDLPKDESEGAEKKLRRVIKVYVLKGTAFSGSKPSAFIEEEVSGKVYILSPGEEIAGIKILRVMKDTIVCSEGDSQSEVKIGGELGRAETKEMVSAGQASDWVDQDEEKDESPADSEKSEILKKLMERRKRQLN